MGRGVAKYKVSVTTYAGCERVAAQELIALGAERVKTGTRVVSCVGTLEDIYRINVWSRIANRVLCRIGGVSAASRSALYDGVRAIDWRAHMTVDTPFCVDVVGGNDALRNGVFTAQVIKDAVCDFWRDRCGRRPDVDPRSPRLRLTARVQGTDCTLSWDTSGRRLHLRGYRPQDAAAPLKENLAAALLALSGYRGQRGFVDPMCGSGTLLVEAALLVKNRAPGLSRDHFGFCDHPSFSQELWRRVRAAAKEAERECEGVVVRGYDVDERAVRAARAAAQGAGVDDIVAVSRRDVRDLGPLRQVTVVTNPPYGRRLGDVNALVPVYAALGQVVRAARDADVHVLTDSRFLLSKMEVAPSGVDKVFNGALACGLYHFPAR